MDDEPTQGDLVTIESIQDFDTEVKVKVERLITNAELVGAKVFRWNEWFVVSYDNTSIEAMKDILIQHDELQNTLNPEIVTTECAIIPPASVLMSIAYEYAHVYIGQRDTDDYQSTYGIHMPTHYVAVKHDLDHKKSVYVDCTTRGSLFRTTQFADNPDKEYGKGLIMIDNLHSSKIIESVYSTSTPTRYGKDTINPSLIKSRMEVITFNIS